MYSTAHQPHKSRTVLQPGLSHRSNFTEENPGITDSCPKFSNSRRKKKKEECVHDVNTSAVNIARADEYREFQVSSDKLNKQIKT